MSDSVTDPECTVVVVCGGDGREDLLHDLRTRGLDPVVLPGAVSSLLAHGGQALDGPHPVRPSPSPDLDLVAKLNEAQRIAVVGSWDWDIRTNSVWWSDETYRIFGVSQDAYTPTVESNASFVHPEDTERFHHGAFHALQHASAFDFDLRIVTPDGMLKHCNFKGNVQRGSDGNPARFSGTIADVTERIRADEALKSKSEELNRYFTLSLDLLCIADVGGHFIRVNPQWERVLGYSTAELEGQLFLDFVHPDDLSATLSTLELSAQQQVASFENRYRCKDGSYRWIEWRSQPQGQFIYAAARDVTDRKRAEEEHLRLEAELMQAQKMESVGRLAGGVAHDFNNMLGVILGHAEMAIMSVDPTHPLHASLAEIRKAATRSADLTRQLLTFARKQAVTPKLIDLNQAVSGSLAMLGRLIGEDIRLQWTQASNLWPVRIDPAQVDQILANLCVNARDAISGIGTIAIATANRILDDAACAGRPGILPGDYVRLEVADSGCGMSPDIVEHIFEPFFTTKDLGKGTGLGLASVYGAVTQNGGFIDVSSTPGSGTTIGIYLPRSTSRADAATTEPTA